MATVSRVWLLETIIFCLAVVVAGKACPQFVCGEGRAIKGKFTDSTDPRKDPNGREFLTEVYFPTGQTSFPEDPGCYRFCAEQNKNLTVNSPRKSRAKYWMFEDMSATGNGGICSCYNEDVCLNDNSFADVWKNLQPGQGVNGFDPAANFTVGMVCEGGDKGDPHFTGADGSHYDFSGVPNRTFAIVSDAHIHVNGYFGGRYGKWGDDIKALTWIRSVGVLFGHHTLVLEARQGPSADYENGYLAAIYADGELVDLPAPQSAITLWEGASIRWVDAMLRSGDDLVDVYDVQIGDYLTMRLTMRPEVKNLRTPTDGVVHFGLDVIRSTFSPAVHGVLGQTYRPDFAGRLEKQKLVFSDLLQVMVVPGDNAEGFIDGGVEDYMVSSLLKANCRYCRFIRAETIDMETAFAVEMMGGAAGGGPPAASARKFLSAA